jgi:hypothetical protein
MCSKKQAFSADTDTKEDLRHVAIDVGKVPSIPFENLGYCDNRISTTKYSA